MLYDEIKKLNLIAMKEKNTTARAIYSVIISRIDLIKVNKREKNEELNEADCVSVVQKVLKELEDEKENYSKVNNVERVENTLKQMELRDKTTTEIKDLAGYTNKHLLYEDVNFNNAIKFVIALSKKTKVKYRISSNTMRVGALAAELTNLNDGDYFLIDYNSLSDTTIAKLIHATKKMELCFNHNGKNVKLPLPRFNCVIFTECKETIDESLLKCLEVVK